MRTFSLATQLLRRDWRSGELATLVGALLIAVTAVLTIALITDRLTAGMARESAELIGGDLVIVSTREPDPGWRQLGAELGLASARIHLFDSVIFAGDDMLLSSVKAVSDSYPLLGQLEVAPAPGEPSAPVAGIPSPGNAWVDARVLERLNANVGDSINFGATTLTIERILTLEPDEGGGLFSFAPRILINEADLEPAQVLGPGSRIRYRTLFLGANSEALRQRLEPTLGVGHRLLEPDGADNRASAALLKATQYIRIATLLSLVLAAIAIALTAKRYSERHYDVSAMLRCLGAQQHAIFRLYVYQLGLLTAATTAAAAVLGWLAHLAVLQVLQPLLPVALPQPGAGPWLVAVGSAFLLIAGFALPPVLRLASTPPLRVLRRDLSPVPVSVWLVYGLAAASQGLLLWLLFDDLPDILLILLATAAVLFVLGWIIYRGLLRLKGTIGPQRGHLGRGLRNIASHAATSTSQIMAFGLTIMLVITVTQLRSGLLEEWRVQLPEDAPNHFAFNIFPHQVADFTRLVSARAELKPLYPVVRGRMLAINGDPEAVRKGGDDRRELNLTWAETLPADNQVLAGTWPPRDNGISMEVEYASRLDVGLGDTLTMDVNGQRFDAVITSLRSVVWESFSPNFYLVFSQQQLGNLPTTYLTSFHLDPEDATLIKALLAEFPALTLIEVESILQRMQLILAQVSLSVEMIMGFVLLSGFAVLFATLQTTADERIQEGALMRAMGASRQYLKRAYLLEFGLIGLFAGLLAIVGADIATAVIYRQVFAMTYSPSPALWLVIPLAMASLVAGAGYLGSRRVLRVSPMRLLGSS